MTEIRRPDLQFQLRHRVPPAHQQGGLSVRLLEHFIWESTNFQPLEVTGKLPAQIDELMRIEHRLRHNEADDGTRFRGVSSSAKDFRGLFDTKELRITLGDDLIGFKRRIAQNYVRTFHSSLDPFVVEKIVVFISSKNPSRSDLEYPQA